MRQALYILLSFSLILTCSYANEVLDVARIESIYHKGTYIHTRIIIHNPEKVIDFCKEYKDKIPCVTSQFEVEANPNWSVIPQGWDLILESKIQIVQDKDLILYTNDIQECIGITVWDHKSKTAALFHASRMYLSEATSNLFKRYFIDKLKEKIEDFSQASVNLISCYWSTDALLAIKLLMDNDIPISGLCIPRSLIKRENARIIRYVDKNEVLPVYTNGNPAIALALDTTTGKIGFKFYNR